MTAGLPTGPRKAGSITPLDATLACRTHICGSSARCPFQRSLRQLRDLAGEESAAWDIGAVGATLLEALPGNTTTRVPT